MSPKIVEAHEVHHAGQHLARITVEVDIVDFDRLVGGLDAGGCEAQIDRMCETAEAMRKLRDDEAATVAAQNAQPDPTPAQDDAPTGVPSIDISNGG